MTRIDQAGRMPDFIIIGAMKSGTSSLYSMLRRHPEIYLSDRKEPQYFSRDNIFALGEKYYRNLFVDAAPHQIIGEASTCYSRWPQYPHAAKRIAERLPDIRLIYLMRHPVERSYSHYRHLMQERMIYGDRNIITFEESIEEHPEIIDASMYRMQIEHYLSAFERDKMLLLTLDEMKSAPQLFLERVLNFIEVEPLDLIKNEVVKANKWGDRTVRSRIRNFVQSFKKMPGFPLVKNVVTDGRLLQLQKMIYSSKLLNSIFQIGLEQKQNQLSPLTQNTRTTLLGLFEEPTRQLEKFIGYELPSWHT